MLRALFRLAFLLIVVCAVGALLLGYRWGSGPCPGTRPAGARSGDVAAVRTRAPPRLAPGVPVLYWGRSLGGTMAAYAATVRRPDGVIVESGFADVRSLLVGSPLAVVARLSSYRFPTAEFLARAQTPVLVMHGDADRVVPFAAGTALFERLSEPKRFVVIPGGDHNDLAPPDETSYWNELAAFATLVR
jgi:fermentation-respiration switch protein FrsA (DUF1100 family)